MDIGFGASHRCVVRAARKSTRDGVLHVAILLVPEPVWLGLAWGSAVLTAHKRVRGYVVVPVTTPTGPHAA